MDLVQEILNGNQKAEETLYSKYKKIVLGFISEKYSKCRNIDDCVSEILVKIFANLKKYDSTKAKFNTWAFAIAKNHMIDNWRISSTNILNNYQSLDIRFDNFNNTDIFSTTTFENKNTIDFISSQISNTDYTLLSMKYLQGYDYKEIGEKYQITSSTASNRINYIKLKLKNSLTNKLN